VIAALARGGVDGESSPFLPPNALPARDPLAATAWAVETGFVDGNSLCGRRVFDEVGRDAEGVVRLNATSPPGACFSFRPLRELRFEAGSPR
jgi:hypothetical protein